jgi:hypothetical protein
MGKLHINKDLWELNHIQFPRLLAEIVATQDNLNMQELCESMDLDEEDVYELFERAQSIWERVKIKYCP